ncbi:hypothetical protein ACWEVD_01890 [Nocardia thailandica]|uniref:hypothetical protein n=1 Tax=Nocardia thailandica TaxID=257275 RepID=UPI0002E6F399|nr:hypothetical protein [Nocardia thailandica]
MSTSTLTAQDAGTLRTAAYGAVALLAAAGAPHKGIAQGSRALTSATGLVGHVLAARSRDIDLPGKSVADLAGRVLPGLTASMRLLADRQQAEADNFRDTVLIAVESAAGSTGGANPAVAAMARKIEAALDAA